MEARGPALAKEKHQAMKDRHPHPHLRPIELAAVLALLTMLAAAGCGPRETYQPRHANDSLPSPAATSSLIDGCEGRLQNLAVALLLYYAQHNQLPPNLKSLQLPSGDPATAITCPVSHQPYIYDPSGIPAP